MTPDFAAGAEVLDEVADVLTRRPTLDPDGAIRLVIYGNADSRVPDDDSPKSALYDDVVSALTADHADLYLGRDSDPLPAEDIPAGEAIQAARSAANRFRSYVR